MRRIKNNINHIIITILLTLGLLALLHSRSSDSGGFVSDIFYHIDKIESEKVRLENLRILKLEEENALRSELDEILEQYHNSRYEIDNLSLDLQDKESKINDLKNEIRDLLNVKYDLELAREKIERLQEISKKYFNQVDSLLGETEQQKKVIDSLRFKNKEISNQNQNLNQENIDLNDLLDLGSSLKVSKIEIFKIKFGTHQQERIVSKAKNIQVLRSCFTISANSIAASEKKSVYIQYLDPNNNLLVSSDTPNNASFMIGDSSINATVYNHFDYNNKDIDMCVDWERGDMLESGKYTMIFFIEGKIAGEFMFELY